MELRQLRHFLAVAEELHFGRAAERLHISQPPLSQSIRRLEEELGTALFARTSRSVALTEHGRYLLSEAREIVERADNAARTLELMARGERGVLRVGLVGPALEGPLPCRIRRYGQDHPDVCVQLEQLNSYEQLDRLRAGTLDLGFVRLFKKPTRGLTVRPYFSEPYDLALPQGHHLAEKETVRLADLEGEPLLIFHRRTNPALYDALLAAFSEAGVCPDLIHVSLVKHTTTALVAAGMGVTLMSRGMAGVPRPGVVFRPIEGRLPPVEFSIAWATGRYTPLMDGFVQAMNEGDAQAACEA